MDVHDLPSGINRLLFQQTGFQNRSMGKPCEDVIFTRETPELCFWGLADGQSGARYGAQGGQACLKALETLLRETGLGGLLDHPFPDELPCKLMKTIRGSILSLCRTQGGEFRDYASTVLAMAMAPATGRYALAHLGDGCAVGIGKDGALTMLSAPENGPVSVHHTWLTTSDNAVAHLRLRFGCFSENARVILMTDGVKQLSRGKNIPRQAKEKLTHGSLADIAAYLRESDPLDDASCIVLDRTHPCTPSHPEDGGYHPDAGIGR